MAELAAHTRTPTSQTNTTNPNDAPELAPHGIKRAADTSLDHEQRLSKRFDLQTLVDDNGTRLFYGVPSSNPSLAHSGIHIPARKPRPPPPDTSMRIDDTPTRIYIPDLAAELAALESDEDTPIFLPDIEKHIAKIPRHVLRGSRSADDAKTEENQVVLYNVPSSLSVAPEKDSVRKAIVEARRRIREGMAGANGEGDAGSGAVGSGMPVQVQNGYEEQDDDDAMDLD
ncbi:hypothetical protein IQ07DRAFT_583462 [Pyrenochaeta sp. DS3sAY3a]|nr:hypothetical protein IQ07DRAFT_583462 [Pyrenochaeta sp. DS3sAY3a]